MKIQDNVGYYFTIQDLQDRLRVSRSTILRLIESKKWLKKVNMRK